MKPSFALALGFVLSFSFAYAGGRPRSTQDVSQTTSISGQGGVTSPLNIAVVNATTANEGSTDSGIVWAHGGITLGDTATSTTVHCYSSGGVNGECLTIGGASTFVGSVQLKGRAANAGAETALVFGNGATLADTQALAQFRNGNLFSSTKVVEIMSTGKMLFANADAGVAGDVTINQPTGKSAIANGAGSITLTNSLITAASFLQLTLITDDTGCTALSAVPGSGSAVINCNGAGTCATATGCNFGWEVRN